jgi:hypothetical protein
VTYVPVGVALGLIAVLMVAAACGSPDGDAPEFVYTPVPYTVQPSTSGEPFIISEKDGGLYEANKILVTVERDRQEHFTDWLEAVEFGVGGLLELPNGSSVLLSVTVPPGSAPDAVELVKRQRGVISAGLAWILEGHDEARISTDRHGSSARPERDSCPAAARCVGAQWR